MLLFFLYQLQCVCPHLQLKRQHRFVCVVSIDRGLWAHMVPSNNIAVNTVKKYINKYEYIYE